MAENSTERLHYYQGQYLGALDFADEQQYHRDMRRRLNIGAHTWGIVTGLELVEIEREGGGVDLYVMPGMAIDGYGREILVWRPHLLDTADFQRLPGGDHYDVWIGYAEEQASRTEASFATCDEEEQYNRTRELFRVFAHPDEPEPKSVVVDGQEETPPNGGDDDAYVPPDLSVPYQEFPEGVQDQWLVRLGSVLWNGSGFDPAADGKLNEGREYIRQVAAKILAPEGKLTLSDRSTKTLSAGDEGLAVTVEGSLQAERDITAKADVHVDGGLVDFRKSNGDESEEFALTRHDRELRLRIGKASAGENSLKVGPQSDAGDPGSFTPAVTVQDDGLVGVGTEAPEHRLQIGNGEEATSASLRGPDGNAEGAALAFENSDGLTEGWFKLVYDSNLNLFKLVSAEQDPIVSFGRSNGRMGIGTAEPDAALHITGGRDVSLSNQTGYLVMGDVSGENMALDNNEIQARESGTSKTLHLQAEGGGLKVHHWLPASQQVTVDTSGNLGLGTTTPAAKLEVKGDVRLGNSGALFALGGLLNLRVIVGDVDQNGVVLNGSGFTAARNDTGQYTVNFNDPFSGNPVILASPVNAVNEDNVVSIRDIFPSNFKVRTKDVEGGESYQNTRFNFIALGRR